MDYEEAVRVQAAEKYVLGELPAILCEAYEEHYFDCRECAIDVKAVTACADTVCEMLKQGARRAMRYRTC